MNWPSEVWLWIGGIVVFVVLMVAAQWFLSRDRWRRKTETSVGEGAYRAQTATTLGAPVFPKRLALLATLTNLWGLLTLLFAVAGFLLIDVTTGHTASKTLVGLVSCSGIVLSIASFIVASRIMRRSDRAFSSACGHAVFGLVHHLALLAVFGFAAGDIQEMFPVTLVPCAIGLANAAFMHWGARALGTAAPAMSA